MEMERWKEGDETQKGNRACELWMPQLKAKPGLVLAVDISRGILNELWWISNRASERERERHRSGSRLHMSLEFSIPLVLDSMLVLNFLNTKQRSSSYRLVKDAQSGGEFCVQQTRLKGEVAKNVVKEEGDRTAAMRKLNVEFFLHYHSCCFCCCFWHGSRKKWVSRNKF